MKLLQEVLTKQAFAFQAHIPGTPSTEINENVATYPEIYSEWAPN